MDALSSIVFLVEFIILYKLYYVLWNRFINNDPDMKRSRLENDVFKVAYVTASLYLMEISGVHFSRMLIETGILWVLAVIVVSSLLYRITVSIEKRLE
ncbi:MAG: hypothetical protein RBT65_11110 [Methanolobus sp.]|nr:hypothetical protein [Methanolobus sp.]